MRPFRRFTRILILSFLTVSVFLPIFLLSHKLKHLNSDVSKEFVEDLSIIKHRTDIQALSAVEEDEGALLKEPSRDVYKDVGFNSGVSLISSDEENRSIGSGNVSRSFDENRGSELGNTLGTSDDENKRRELGSSMSTSDEENKSSETEVVLRSSDEENTSESAEVLSSPDEEKSGNDSSSLAEDNSSVSGHGFRLSERDNSNNELEKAAEDVNLSITDGTSNNKGHNSNKKEVDLRTSPEEKNPPKKELTRPTTKAQPSDEKVKAMKDQILRAKMYLNFVPPGSNSHFVKELKLRIKDEEHALGRSSKDSDLSRK